MSCKGHFLSRDSFLCSDYGYCVLITIGGIFLQGGGGSGGGDGGDGGYGGVTRMDSVGGDDRANHDEEVERQVEARVLEWARGKDIVAMLSTIDQVSTKV